MGRESIFRGKTHRVQATISDDAKKVLERERGKLAKQAGRETASDADTIEAILLGESKVRGYLRSRRK